MTVFEIFWLFTYHYVVKSSVCLVGYGSDRPIKQTHIQITSFLIYFWVFFIHKLVVCTYFSFHHKPLSSILLKSSLNFTCFCFLQTAIRRQKNIFFSLPKKHATFILQRLEILPKAQDFLWMCVVWRSRASSSLLMLACSVHQEAMLN